MMPLSESLTALRGDDDTGVGFRRLLHEDALYLIRSE